MRQEDRRHGFRLVTRVELTTHPEAAQRADERTRLPGSIRAAAFIEIGVVALVIVNALSEGRISAFGAIVATLLLLSSAGLFAGKRIAYVLTVWGLAAFLVLGILAVVAEATSSKILGLGLFIVPFALLLAPSAREWSKSDKRTDPQVGAGRSPSASATPTSADLPGWRPQEWAGGRVKFWFMAVFGAFVSLAGLAMSITERGTERGVGVTVTFFGLALLAALPMFRTWKREGKVMLAHVEQHGNERGLVFPYSASKNIAARRVMLLMALSGLGLALFPDSFADGGESPVVIRLLGIAIAGGCALMFVASRRRGTARAWYVALLPSGIAAVARGISSFVPWEVIVGVRAVQMRLWVRGFPVREPFVGLMISDPSRVETSGVARAMIRANRLFGADVTYAVRTLDVEPALLMNAIDFYSKHPEKRHETGTEEGLARVSSGRLTSSEQSRRNLG